MQLVNGERYLRGLLEEGPRKSLEPMVARLGGEADYESLQQFLAVSPWDPGLVVRAVAERVAPRIAVEAWVLDDTGFPKDGKHSPGVKRGYSGTLGKIGNCQIGVSVHAVGANGTVPLGWALYLPEDWCEDPERRRAAKIPEEIEFKTKPQLGRQLIEPPAAGISPGPLSWVMRHMARTPSCARISMTLASSTCSRSIRPRACSPRTRYSRFPSAPGRPGGLVHGCVPTASPSRSTSSSNA